MLRQEWEDNNHGTFELSGDVESLGILGYKKRTERNYSNILTAKQLSSHHHHPKKVILSIADALLSIAVQDRLACRRVIKRIEEFLELLSFPN